MDCAGLVGVNAYPCFAVHLTKPCNFWLAEDALIFAQGEALLVQPVQDAGKALVMLPAFAMDYNVILYLYYAF